MHCQILFRVASAGNRTRNMTLEGSDPAIGPQKLSIDARLSRGSKRLNYHAHVLPILRNSIEFPRTEDED